MTDLYSAELAKKQELVAICDTLKARVVELEAENERLTKHAHEQRSRQIAEWDEKYTLAVRVAELEAENERLAKHAHEQRSRRIAEWDEIDTLATRVAELEACGDVLEDRDEMLDRIAELEENMRLHVDIAADALGERDRLKDWAERLADCLEQCLDDLGHFDREPDGTGICIAAAEQAMKTLTAYREAKP